MRQATAAQKRELDARLREPEEGPGAAQGAREADGRGLAAQKRPTRSSPGTRRPSSGDRGGGRQAKLMRQEINDIIAQQVARGNIPSQYNGTLRWPMGTSSPGEFGCNSSPLYGPGNGCEHFHNGIDIVNPARRSGVRPGTVAYIGWNYADGADPAWIVIVAHSRTCRPGTRTWRRTRADRRRAGRRRARSSASRPAPATRPAATSTGWWSSTGSSRTRACSLIAERARRSALHAAFTRAGSVLAEPQRPRRAGVSTW